MTNRITILIISFIVILVLLVILAVLLRNRSPFGKKETSFSSRPDKEITGVDLSDGRKSVMLTLEDGVWKVSEGGIVVDYHSDSDLLGGLSFETPNIKCPNQTE